MRRLATLLLLAAAFGLALVLPAPAADPAPAPGGRAIDAAVLLEAERAFARDAAARGLDGWMAWFEPDAAIFPRRGPIVRGRDAVREAYVKMAFDPREVSWTATRAEIAASGDLGMTYGTSSFRTKGPDGKPAVLMGKYLTVWRRQPDGSWKVLADMGNIDAP